MHEPASRETLLKSLPRNLFIFSFRPVNQSPSYTPRWLAELSNSITERIIVVQESLVSCAHNIYSPKVLVRA
jgi:hypothetical protein